MLDRLTLESFEPHVGSRFQVESGGQDASFFITLVEATALESVAPADMRSPFSLLFAAPEDQEQGQSVVHLSHDKLGALEVFLVPVGISEDGERLYEAIFN